MFFPVFSFVSFFFAEIADIARALNRFSDISNTLLSGDVPISQDVVNSLIWGLREVKIAKDHLYGMERVPDDRDCRDIASEKLAKARLGSKVQ